MKIYALSDLHLPGPEGKSMEIFGDNWKGHSKKMMENWNKKIGEDDIVLVPGDITWAMNWEDASEDINYLSSLNGTKLIVKGNHDYFLQGNHKCKQWFEDLDNEKSKIRFLYNSSQIINHPEIGKIGIYGTRGWSFIAGEDPDQSKKLCDRELNRLKISYDTLKNKNLDLSIAMFHYPPLNKFFENVRNETAKTNFEENQGSENSQNSELIYKENYDDRLFEFVKSKNTNIIVFGHVHQLDIDSYKKIDGVDVYCCSADIINFDPIKININF